MSVDVENSYLKQVVDSLPRLLAMIDTDRSSRSYGMGDRYFWAWGLIDFGNGTFQGAAHGMARLWESGLWPYSTSKALFLGRIDALFVGAEKLTKQDGSLEEAFPNEGSFCVTALVAFDLLCTLELLNKEIDNSIRNRWQQIIQPMIAYLLKADETHAMISNHLATAVAALVRWYDLTKDSAAEERAKLFMSRIVNHQSSEGWFKEYDGADPGYQSLCTYYLADVYINRPDWGLLAPLRKSIQFLWHFAHPDGSFGGVYGSRCTRFYYPAGILAVANDIPEAAVLAKFMSNSIVQQKVVTLTTMDEPNFIPMFNAFCWAATIEQMFEESSRASVELLPSLISDPYRKHFKQAGLIIDRGASHYTVISTHKGGVVNHFVNRKRMINNAGIVVSNKNGALGSTQGYAENNTIDWLDDQTLLIKAGISEMPKQLSDPFKFIALRLFCISIFRIAPLREWVKQQLVRLLITGNKYWSVENERIIKLGTDLSIEDNLINTNGYNEMKNIKSFIPIHMASQGYWQVQDEESHDSTI